MIDWVDSACKAWGKCTRWIVYGTGAEGYPSKDTIAKAQDGLLNLAAGTVQQHFPEVRFGDALDVARAMRGEPEGTPSRPPMPIDLTATVYTQYVVRARIERRVSVLGEFLRVELSMSEYWRNVDRAHYFLAGRIPAK